MRTILRELVDTHGLHAVLHAIAANEYKKKEWLVSTGFSRNSSAVVRHDRVSMLIFTVADSLEAIAPQCAAQIKRQEQIHGCCSFVGQEISEHFSQHVEIASR